MHIGHQIDGGGGGGGLPVWAIVLIVVAVILIFICVFAAQDSEETEVTTSASGVPQISYEGTTPCYMCLTRIKQSEWNSGEHRKRCFYGNKEEILRYPTPHMIFCPKCGEMLRLWPKKGSSFICDKMNQDECILQTSSPPFKGMVIGDGGGREIINTGLNRFNCFICDYDLCKDCVLQEASAPPNRTFARGNSIKYNKYNFDPFKDNFPIHSLPSNSPSSSDPPPYQWSSQPATSPPVPRFSQPPTIPPVPAIQGDQPPYPMHPTGSSTGGLPYAIHPTSAAQSGLPYSINPISPSAPSAPSLEH